MKITKNDRLPCANRMFRATLAKVLGGRMTATQWVKWVNKYANYRYNRK